MINVQEKPENINGFYSSVTDFGDMVINGKPITAPVF
jgi:hypothetical protein